MTQKQGLWALPSILGKTSELLIKSTFCRKILSAMPVSRVLWKKKKKKALVRFT